MISDLPFDLESEILSWVPSKSLAKLQTTCKRWYTLFKDQSFINKNLCKAAAKKEEEEVLLRMSSGVIYSVKFNLHGIHESIDPSMEFNGKLVKRLNVSKDLEIYQLFTCDGLLLCSRKKKNPRKLVVWNPCTGETRRIEPRDYHCYDMYNKYAIGYGVKSNPCSRSYKILRFSLFKNIEFEIYDMRTDSWRVLDLIDELSFSTRAFSDSGVSLKGNAYWLTSDWSTVACAPRLINFDFSTERFGSLPIPDPCKSNAICDRVILSVVGGEKLALLHDVGYTMSIWLSDKIGEEAAKEVSWSKLLQVDLGTLAKPFMPLATGFLVDEEKKVFVFCNPRREDSVFVVGENKRKQVYRGTTKYSGSATTPLLCAYTPSLVRIK